ncbi:Phosphomethylpyrimidine kinase-domain-containing protein [Phlebopus sp. FC_14]|nr:Phosphomethylpyrimidine kinase-domain-containing protein [Phlebopus sp. FC_14]
MEKHVAAILTIAGSDPSGGAGIQADLKTFAALGCYGSSVLTALTAQNTTGVQGVHGVPPDFVAQQAGFPRSRGGTQIKSVLDDIDVRAIKTGMLFNTENTRAVASTLEERFADKGRIPLVCDPVCVSTSGHALLRPDAIDTMVNELFPLAQLITPNKAEAELLLKSRSLPSSIGSLKDMIGATKNLLTLGSQAVLLKGGHIDVSMAEVESVSTAEGTSVKVCSDFLLRENMEILEEGMRSQNTLVVDVLGQVDGTITLYPRPRIQSTSTHGTGCTLSAALACAVGTGVDLIEATLRATTYTHLGIETAEPIGQGFGPLNHLHSVSKAMVLPRTLGNPFPLTYKLICSTSRLWRQYVQHDFVTQLGKGTLERASFLHFIKFAVVSQERRQDYHYLKYYARAYSLLASKSHDFAPIMAAAEIVFHITRESAMHTSFCAQWGITREELETTPESPATTAYGAFLLDTGLQGDTTKLVMALAACLLGYGEVGLWLKKEAEKPNSWVKWEGNPYLKWMQDYSGEDYQNAVKVGLETIEKRAVADPPSPARYAEWKAVWEQCVLLEKGFWDMAMNKS